MPFTTPAIVAPTYRNTRRNFYSDKTSDTMEIGTIITTFKAIDNSYDNSYIPFGPYKVQSGNAFTPVNPEYQFPGFLYCDGSEYKISDFPALYSVIGNEYGGTSRPGIYIVNGGSGYPTDGTVGIVFANPPNYDPNNPGDLKVISAGITVDTTGKITDVTVSNVGFGYDPQNPPSWQLTNAGTGSGLDLKLYFDSNGQITSITQSNVFEFLGETESLGSFKVPDLLAKKIVGYGNVYGSGSPTIGLTTLGVGADKIGGKWLFDKTSQAGYFSLGSITTTNYTGVTETTSCTVIGSQTVRVNMKPKRIQDVPSHTHYIYHTSADKLQASVAGFSGDRYLVEYTDSDKSLYNFFPVGGVAFEHTHALLKQPLSDNTVATFDIMDYVPGAEGTGSTKWGYENDEYYMASNAAASGTWEQVTYIPITVFRKFAPNSVIGGRTINTGGVPIIEYDALNTYTNPGTYSVSVPTTWQIAAITVAGGGGSGASSNADGGDGATSEFKFDDGSKLLLACTGGQGGKKNSAGGSAGTKTLSGSQSTSFQTIQEKATAGTNGTTGPYYIKSYPSNPNTAGKGGNNSGSATNDGTDGINSYISDTGYTGTQTYTSNGNFNLASTNYTYTSIEIELAGGKGGSRTGGAYPGGTGGGGGKMKLSVKSPSNGYGATFQIGAAGANNTKTGGAGAQGANGGTGGNPNGAGQGGAGGGGATALCNFNTTTIIAGAGGGGGGGGYDGGNGSAGLSGTTNNTPGWNSNSPLATTANLFSGGGGSGGDAGCNGGGGGGAGGGIASSSYAGQGGGYGGGGGGPAGHGGGQGGGRGMSSYNTNIFTLTSSTSDNNGGGYVKYSYTEDRSYWGTGGGGGGAGKFVYGLVDKSNITGTVTTGNITVGAAGSNPSGISAPGGGYVIVGFGKITGYQGGSTTTSVGDIVIAADSTTDLYSSGSGSGSTGGFKLPFTQVPVVEFLGGGGGSGASATVTVSNGSVSGITLTNGGNGYTAVPEVRIKHGAGSGAYATAEINQNTGKVISVSLSNQLTPSSYTTYVKLEGTSLTRFIVIKEQDCTNVKRISFKVARGNGNNGGDLPENGGDELLLYWNNDLSLNFTNTLGEIVPKPTPQEITNNYDGSGSGDEATKWYWYSVDLPEAANTNNVRFKLTQNRNAASGLNDNASDSDHYGICDIIYEYKEVSELQFIPAAGGIPKSADQLTYVVYGDEGSLYTSGATALDATFTLNSQNPLVPTAAIDPDFPVPLVEPYHLCKYLIKAF